LKQVLDALLKLEGSSFEIILIDNNSSNNVPKDVCDFFKANNPKILIKYVLEPKQGLANARICGAGISLGEWLVFVDDDNVLNFDYISELEKVVVDYPQCVCWGPGKIDVVFTDIVPKFFHKYTKKYFQEKSIDDVFFGNDEKWKSYFPTGSGMAIRKDIFSGYEKKYINGKNSLTGRSGEDLSSGEDAQIIWTCIITGNMVGSNGKMKLNHCIDKRRCSVNYLRNLNFCVSRDYYLANWQIFNSDSIFSEKVTFLYLVKLFLICTKKTFPNMFHAFKLFLIEKEWIRGYEISKIIYKSMK
jgi:glycosyltransferase involved in cell wall biosynthesis